MTEATAPAPGVEVAAPLVSVIIPVYNGARFLAEAIRSVYAQDHRPIELIVIDDGSTDASAEVAASFDEVVLIRQENLGPAAARNEGLARATGTFLTFLDADDRMAPGRLSAQLGHLDRHPDVGCVLVRQELEIEQGLRVSWVDPRRPADPGGVPILSAMLRRESLARVGGLDPGQRWTEGMDLLFRLRDAGVRIDLLPSVGLIRGVHRENQSHRLDAIRDGLVQAVRRHLDRSRAGGNGGIP